MGIFYILLVFISDGKRKHQSAQLDLINSEQNH